MLRKISALLSTVLCLGLMVSCSQAENNTIEINNDTPPVETPKTESDTQSADDITESGTTTYSTPYTPVENAVGIPADKVFLNPDGEEFARNLNVYYNDSKEPVVQYWDTGEVLAKFELHPDSGSGNIFKINDHTIDCLYVSNIRQILVENEYIIVVLGGTDINSLTIFIYDHDCNTLFKTYYLSNTGMVTVGAVTITDNRIIINGTRFTHGPSITIGINSHWLEDFSEYSDYLCEDTIYDYGDNFRLPYEVYLDESNADEIKILNPNEKVSAVFEMEYLGGGKFSNLKMVEYKTLGTFLDSYLD